MAGRGRLLGAVLLAHLGASHAGAQVSLETRAANLAANAAIGAVVASAHAALRKDFSMRAAARGAVGGMIMGAGKQIAGRGLDGGGLVARHVHALAVPLVVAAPRDTLRFLFPVGPLTLELRPGARDRWRTRLDVTESLILIIVASTPHTRFDLSASLSAGTPVFAVPRRRTLHYGASGLTIEGVVMLADDLGPYRRPFLAHETVHVLQWDAFRHLVTLPLERALVGRVVGRPDAWRPFDVGILAPIAVQLVAASFPYERHPWEREAYALGETCTGCAPR